ncbi:MAG: FAD-dependent oxidoreductase [Hyphomicrobium sp.]|nr:FAD-dependent oxidoreductase [Hyphomicrobium sp.]
MQLAVTVIGGGIIGLWQALTLAERGHRVTLREAACESATGAASRLAGAMLAPYCEAEAAEEIVKELGLRSLQIWRAANLGVAWRGTLVVAHQRDAAELLRFQRLTEGHQLLTDTDIGTLEPVLVGRFQRGLLFPDEGHIAPRRMLATLVERIRALGGDVRFESAVAEPVWMAASAGEIVIDCRGIAARNDVTGLRGVRGEMAVVTVQGMRLTRPVRLLHPRFPIYVVPWGEDTFMIGATSIESEHARPVSLKSAIELLASAYALHPAFADARIVELSAGIRPAFADNIPKILAKGRRLIVNGTYRHGFLLAPVLAQAVAVHLETGAPLPAALTCAS